ncbi:hypothetical protein LZ198_28295 [Myxococcus sp. K15C18031901]|uniref:hypothetical protein n=1 Tax=Myxococcus dinghuensis TaxID=2906761 RepID=UPI0020A747F5|nr:hypothetical protein [Myxococcus dinghuensis]MCP3102784.1 hypothetical protein [Myxococcus dinghuensis]
MSTPPLPVYELDNPPQESFWRSASLTSRHVFIVPIVESSSFVAFGTRWPSSLVEVCFVARGKVEEHLGDFVARMTRDEAQVELCLWPPLPKALVEQFGTIPPYEGHEYEPPSGTPVRGATTTSNVQPYSRLRGTPLWTDEDITSRYTYLAPLSDSSTFLAIGYDKSTQRVVFAAQGSLTGDLGDLIAQVVEEQSFVELHGRPPLPPGVLDLYVEPYTPAPQPSL